MQRFYIEGLFISRQKIKKGQKSGRGSKADVEPFAQTFWAENAAEALQQANEAIAGGQWLDGPRISDLSEEDRMRQMGAPQLPGFGLQVEPKLRRKSGRR